MKLKNLQIENYRSIENLSIDFHQQLNVFVGANGAGKSTILDAVATSLSHLIRRIENPNRTGLQISYEDIRNETDACLLRCGVEENEKEFYWQVNKVNKGRKSIYKSDYSELNQLVDHFQKELKEKKQLPVVCSYPISREVEKINPKVDNNGVGDIFKTYENALDGRRDYKRFFEWFRNQEDILNQEMISSSSYFIENIEWIRDQVEIFLKEFRRILQIYHVDLTGYEHLFESFSDDLTFTQPRYLFSDLGRLISNIIMDSDVLNKSILKEVQYLFHKADILGRPNSFVKEPEIQKEQLNQLKTVIKEAIYKLINYTQINNSVFWSIFLNSINLIFWWRSDRKEIIEIIKHIESKPNDELKQRSILFAKISKKPFRDDGVIGGLELKTIKQTLASFLPDYTNMRVERKGKPQMLIDKNGQTFSMEQLSDGEKNLIALIGDIARRFALAYPNSSNPLHENGIILIDEVDLHLHPAWQRLVIPKLVETFPNSQFFISTHSPQVISHVKHTSLFLLKNIENRLYIRLATESYGKTSDRILEDILGVDARPSEEKIRLNAIYVMIEEGKLEEAKKEIKNLEQIIIGGEPELSKARVLIKRKEIIGR